MRVAALVVSSATFLSFAWGAVCFFRKPGGLSRRPVIVALLGVLFGGWQTCAIVMRAPASYRALAALGLYSISGALFWSAVRAGRAIRLTAIFEADIPTRILRHGPYRYVRHPFYASYSLYWIAGWTWSGSVGALLAPITMIAIYVAAARHEEAKFESSALRSHYRAYRDRTGLFVPKRTLAGTHRQDSAGAYSGRRSFIASTISARKSECR